MRKLRLLLFLPLLPILLAAQSGNQLYVVATKTKWIFGEPIKLEAVVRNSAGSQLPTPTVAWSVEPLGSGKVDANGIFTPVGLENVVIRAITADNLRAEILLQILPKSIEVLPERSSMTVGTTQTVRAEALDINGRAIPAAVFVWRLENLAGFWNVDRPMATINVAGRLEARAQGRLKVLATIPYRSSRWWLPGFLSEAYGETTIDLQAKQTYTFEHVLTATPVNRGRRLMGRPTALMPTEDDGFVFAASLDNVTSSLLEWKSGSIRPLLTAGRSHSSTSQPLINFAAYARNHPGEMLTMENDTLGNIQVSAGAAALQQPLLVPRTPLYLAERTDYFEIQRNSIADNGMKIVRVSYIDAVSRESEFGLFRGPGKGLEDVVMTTTDGLPGHFGEPFQLYKFGVAEDGTAWFTTSFVSDNQVVLWKQKPYGAIEKVIAIGDLFQGSEVTGVQVGGDWTLSPGLFVASNGDAVVSINTRARSCFLRWIEGRADPELLTTSVGGLYWHEPKAGTLLRTNYSNQGDGLYLWGAGANVQRLLRIGDQVEGSPVTDVYSATVNSRGVVFAMVATADSPMVIIQLKPGLKTILKAGDDIALGLPPAIASFLPGRGTGVPMLLVEGLTGSIARITNQNQIEPVISVGDLLPGGSRYSGSSKDQVFVLGDGSFVFVASSGIFKSSSIGIERITQLPVNGIGTPYAIKVNSGGKMAAQVYSGQLTGTYEFANAAFTPVIRNNDAVDGEVFLGNFSPPAIDDSGRIAFSFRNDHGSHLALWDGKRTSRILSKGSVLPDGRVVSDFWTVKASGSTFVAGVGLTDNSGTFIRYTGSVWEYVAGRNDVMPTGNYVDWVEWGRFDLNSGGDVTFFFNGQQLVLKKGSVFHQIHDFGTLTGNDELLLAITDLHLNDDGVLYVLASTDAGDQVIYRGIPGVAATTSVESQPFALSAHGLLSTITSGRPDTITGFSRIQPNTGASTPFGVAIFGLRQNNVLITEAGVPSVPLIRRGRFYAEAGGAVNTGIAIANTSTDVAVVEFTITGPAGETTRSGTLTVGRGSQIAQFLDQGPFNTTNFQGAFTFNSNIPVAVTALRGFTNERGHFLITTLPVADASAPLEGDQYLPHFAISAQWSTQLMLVNPSESSLEGTFAFYTSESGAATGQPIELNIGGKISKEFTYSLPPRGMQRLVPVLTVNSGASGFIVVKPRNGGAAPSAAAVFTYRNNNVTVSEAGVSASPVGKGFRTYVELFKDFSAGEPGSISTGIALANTTSVPASVNFELVNQSGVPTGIRGSMQVPSNGQRAAFVHEIIGAQSTPRDFKGTMRITSNTTISVLTLRGRNNELSDFLVTTLPTITDGMTVSGDRVFPHIADGGGYSTQFILIGPETASTAGTMRFYNNLGQPLALRLQ